MPWQDDEEWDDALRKSDGIRVGGVEGAEYLVRPDELICDARVWTNPEGADEEEVQRRLFAVDASEVGDDPRLGTAERLNLKLLNVPSERAYEVVDAAQDIAPGKVDFVHMVVANPQRYGGCGVPEPITASMAIPGRGREGATMRIAVLDTGVAADSTSWVDGASNVESGPSGPASGHGTMVAGVIARYAPGATILVTQVLELPLGVADELDVAKALAAVPEDVNIINASFGGPAADSGRMEALRRALRQLPESTIVVASAGNEGVSRRHYMAAFERVVGVASVENGKVAGYSNRGEWIKLSTQGTDVETLRSANDRVNATGTSFAAPKIAARIVTDAGPGGDVVQAKDALIQTGGNQIPGAGTFVDIP